MKMRSFAGLLLSCYALFSQTAIQWSAQEKPLYTKIRGLRDLADDVRARETRALALDIRALPLEARKLTLANLLASRATEGDFGRDVLQEVTTTLETALREQPVAGKPGPDSPYAALAQLMRYEHMKVSLKAPQLGEAMAALEADDQFRQSANFTLADLTGKPWSLEKLRGKVVVVNFWATWCPPCRKEIPDLDYLSQRFGKDGLVILGISDEELAKVQPFVAEHHMPYPVLLDPGRKVNELFRVVGIPKTFVYNREGRLVAQSIDMRTRSQFMEMLSAAGLR